MSTVANPTPNLGELISKYLGSLPVLSQLSGLKSYLAGAGLIVVGVVEVTKGPLGQKLAPWVTILLGVAVIGLRHALSKITLKGV